MSSLEYRVAKQHVHDLITEHRSFCPYCRFNEAVKGIPPTHDDSCRNMIPIDPAH